MTRRCTGFTLVELVTSIVLTAIALTMLLSIFTNAPVRSAEPLLMIRGAEFAQALMDEILAKPYDEFTPVGGVPACSPCSVSLGAEGGESRTDFDDVDDYHDYCGGSPLRDTLDNAPSKTINYSMSVCVVYDADYDGIDDVSPGNAKLITVTIGVPERGGTQNIVLSAYRGNF